MERDPASTEQLPEPDVVSVVVPKRVIHVIKIETDISGLRRRAPHVVVNAGPEDEV